MQMKDNLLTPVEFYNLITMIFKTYLDQKKPPILREGVHNNFEAPIAQNNFDTNTLSGLAGKFGFILKKEAKKTMVTVYENWQTFSALNQFVTKEMQDILAQDGASAVTKMTNLTILFQGYYNFMALQANSQGLLPLLESVKRRLWAATQSAEANSSPSSKSAENNSEIIGRDELAFNDTFFLNIKRAQELLGHMLTDSTQKEYATYKQGPFDNYDLQRKVAKPATFAALNNQVAPILNYDIWHYRCEDSADKIPKEHQIKILRDFWRNERKGVYGCPEERLLAYTQLGVSLLQEGSLPWVQPITIF